MSNQEVLIRSPIKPNDDIGCGRRKKRTLIYKFYAPVCRDHAFNSLWHSWSRPSTAFDWHLFWEVVGGRGPSLRRDSSEMTTVNRLS